MENPESKGVTFNCDPKGRILNVLVDQLGLLPDSEDAGGKMLSRFISHKSIGKMLQMLEEAFRHGGSYNWEIHLHGRPVEVSVLLFHAVKVNDKLLVSGVTVRQELDLYFDELIRINNEHVNELRKLVKKNRSGTSFNRIDEELYDELSRLNNDLVNTQRKLSKQAVELENSNHLKNQMLGMAAHDLRNPLMVIQNFSQFLLDDQRESPFMNRDQEELLKELYDSSRLMLSIVEDLLDLAAIESGSVRLRLEDTDLSELIRRVVSLQKQRAERKGIELKSIVPESAVVRHLDTRKMEQVFNNLLTNAVKFSEPGTTTTVQLSQLKSGEVEIDVRDQGVGIPKEKLSELFQPFSDIGVKPTGGESSTGLGLAISRKIVSAHSGRISVESEEGVGSSFVVTLP